MLLGRTGHDGTHANRASAAAAALDSSCASDFASDVAYIQRVHTRSQLVVDATASFVDGGSGSSETLESMGDSGGSARHKVRCAAWIPFDCAQLLVVVASAISLSQLIAERPQLWLPAVLALAGSLCAPWGPNEL